MGFHEFPSRVKTLYRPELIVEPGIHFPHRPSPGTVNVEVDTGLAFLAHHRGKSDPAAECVLDMRIRPFYRRYLDLLKDARSSLDSYMVSLLIS